MSLEVSHTCSSRILEGFYRGGEGGGCECGTCLCMYMCVYVCIGRCAGRCIGRCLCLCLCLWTCACAFTCPLSSPVNSATQQVKLDVYNAISSPPQRERAVGIQARAIMCGCWYNQTSI